MLWKSKGACEWTCFLSSPVLRAAATLSGGVVVGTRRVARTGTWTSVSAFTLPLKSGSRSLFSEMSRLLQPPPELNLQSGSGESRALKSVLPAYSIQSFNYAEQHIRLPF